MPKEGLTAEQWNARLKQYAAGSFTFGRGQRPGKGSKWAKKLKTIESCPKYKNPNKLDPYRRRICCKCGYHSVSHIAYPSYKGDSQQIQYSVTELFANYCGPYFCVANTYTATSVIQPLTQVLKSLPDRACVMLCHLHNLCKWDKRSFLLVAAQ